MSDKVYIAIDLKSFYASAECISRGLDALDTNLVVADLSRTEKTICLAVTPSLKSYGISGRARLFEVIERVNEINAVRKLKAPGREFKGSSHCASELLEHPEYSLDYIVAPPRMAYYKKISTEIYGIYLKYFSPEDIHVYSIDEVFIDVTNYLSTYKTTPRELCMRVIKDVLGKTGITATAGIGTNLYLCKIAMDIEAKHIKPDKNGVRIAELDEMSYRKKLWSHTPITDFWRVGAGTAKRLAAHYMFTMGDVAYCSYKNEDLLYKLFGVNAELLIDHAWGYEPSTIPEIKAYRPENNSLSTSQVLREPYPADKARTVLSEMADSMALDLVDKGFVTDQMTVTVNYDVTNLYGNGYKGETAEDRYGRKVPKHAHGTENFEYTSSGRVIAEAALKIFDRTVNKDLFIRKLNISVNRIISEREALSLEKKPDQLDVFTDYAEKERMENAEKEALSKEHEIQKAVIGIKKKYGKNSILKGTNFREGATARERNGQIGGHKA